MADIKEVKQIAPDRFRHAENEYMALIKDGEDVKKYSEWANSANAWFKDGGDRILAQTDATVIDDTDPDPKAKKKTKKTKYKAGFDDYKDGTWSLGLKDGETEVQHYINPSAKVGSNDGITWVELVQPINNTILNDELDLTSLWGEYGDIKYESILSGCITRHAEKIKLKDDFGGYTYYGTKHVVGDAATLDIISVKADSNIELYIYSDPDNLFFVEYFSADDFTENFEHNYSTPTDPIGSDPNFSNETVYFTGTVSNGSGIDITIGANTVMKYDPSTNGRLVVDQASTTLATSGTSAANPVTMTSMNDDSIGETISGSTGTPISNPHDNNFISIGNGGVTTNIDHLHMQYNTGNALDFFRTDATTVKHCRCRYITGTAVYYEDSTHSDDALFQHWDVDDTNVFTPITGFFNLSSIANNLVEVKDSVFDFGTAAIERYIIYAKGSTSLTVSDVQMRANKASAQAFIFGLSSDASQTVTCNILRCFIQNTNSITAQKALNFNHTAGNAMTVNVTDCVIHLNDSAASTVGIVNDDAVNCTVNVSYCGFRTCDTSFDGNCTDGGNNNTLSSDPATTVPGSAVMNTADVAYATDLIMKTSVVGALSDTRANLGLASTQSSTGLDEAKIGPQIDWTTFHVPSGVAALTGVYQSITSI